MKIFLWPYSFCCLFWFLFPQVSKGSNIDRAEALLTVAAVACTTEVAVMNIVTTVTIDAAPVVTAKPVYRPVVTGMAMHFGVRMPEHEVGSIVIEVPDQPGIGIVAIGTILSQALFVHIVRAVTVDTGLVGLTKNRGRMAGLATEYGMLAYEGKTAQVMVESNALLPGLFIVALIALVALILLVDIVLPVAAVTVGIDFLGPGTDHVTCLADQVFMRAVKCKIGVCIMVEFCILPFGDGMTVLALFTI